MLIVLIGIITLSGISYINTTYKINKEETTIVIEGTSNIHDWHMNVTDFVGDADIVISNDKILVRHLNLEIKSKEIKSDSEGMDKKTHNALKSNKYPVIKFKHKRISKSVVKDGAIIIESFGDLTIAGITKEIKLVSKVISVDDNTIRIENNNKIKMTDFDIEPPTALFGTIKSGDEILIKSNLVFLINQ